MIITTRLKWYDVYEKKPDTEREVLVYKPDAVEPISYYWYSPKNQAFNMRDDASYNTEIKGIRYWADVQAPDIDSEKL